MVWHWPADKQLSEPMMVIYWFKYASLGLNELTFQLLALHSNGGFVQDCSNSSVLAMELL